MTSLLLPWARLARLALLPSILWDLVAGALVAGLAWDPRLLAPLLGVVLLYHGGMALNDVADVALDREAGRRRPLVTGAVSRRAAAAFAAALLGLGWALLRFGSPHGAGLAELLLGVVLLYDLGGDVLRHWLGPGLLALARTLAFLALPWAVFGRAALFTAGATPPIPVEAPLVQALGWLFLARLATHEETGLPGMRVLPYLLMTAVVPGALLRLDPWWPVFVPLWLGFAALLVAPVWPRRHERFPPEELQAVVRRGLGAMPLLPTLVVLAVAPSPWALGGLLAVPAVRFLARRLPPE